LLINGEKVTHELLHTVVPLTHICCHFHVKCEKKKASLRESLLLTSISFMARQTDPNMLSMYHTLEMVSYSWNNCSMVHLYISFFFKIKTIWFIEACAILRF